MEKLCWQYLNFGLAGMIWGTVLHHCEFLDTSCISNTHDVSDLIGIGAGAGTLNSTHNSSPHSKAAELKMCVLECMGLPG